MLACAQWPQTDASRREIQRLCTASMDWEELLALSAHHRLLPMVQRSLALAQVTMPEQTRSALRAAALTNAHATVRYMGLVTQLLEVFAGEGIPVRVLKGVPLSVLAFSDASLRDVGDVDLLIPPGYEERADSLVTAGGFIRRVPAAVLTPRRLRSYLRHAKDFTYEAAHTPFEVDLHWRLFRNPALEANGLGDLSCVQTVRIGDMDLKTLPPVQAFLHVCVHGALDGWFRLKSLADVAALWRRFNSSEREGAAALAREHGVLGETVAALTLACTLGVLEQEELTPSLLLHAGDASVRRIVAYALRNFYAAEFKPGPVEAGSWRLKGYELSLHSGFRYRTEILRRVLFRPRTWERFDLPDALFPLYLMLSPVEWLLFHSKQKSEGHSKQNRDGHSRRKRVGEGAALKVRPRGRYLLGVRQRWGELSVRQKGVLAEAGAALLAARLLLKILPVSALVRWLKRPVAAVPKGRWGAGEQAAQVEEVRWAVLSVARHSPVRFVCFPQAIAAHALLRRRGVPSRVVYGVRRAADTRLCAHTWLEVGGETILGGETAPLFAALDGWSAPSSG